MLVLGRSRGLFFGQFLGVEEVFKFFFRKGLGFVVIGIFWEDKIIFSESSTHEFPLLYSYRHEDPQELQKKEPCSPE